MLYNTAKMIFEKVSVMNRIEKLRAVALNTNLSRNKFDYLFYKEYNGYSELNEYKRYAKSFSYAFQNLKAIIHDDKLIVKNFNAHLSKKEEWNNKYALAAQKRAALCEGGQDSHMAVDYELILSKSLNEIIKMIDGYLYRQINPKPHFITAASSALQPSSLIRKIFIRQYSLFILWHIA